MRVLQAYASRDFRGLTSAEVAPCVERIAWFWAYSSANSRAVAWDKAGEEVARIPDYSRIAAAMGYSVQMGNVMLQAWLPLEFAEITKIYQLSHGRELEKKEWVSALNQAPERCFKPDGKDAPEISVIGWGLWALQLQHHLCQAIATDYNSLQRKLGVPEDAQEFAKKSEDEFGGLRFYAFVRRLVCADAASYRKSVDEGWAFWTEFPHLTPIRWPDYLCGKVSFAPLYLGGFQIPIATNGRATILYPEQLTTPMHGLIFQVSRADLVPAGASKSSRRTRSHRMTSSSADTWDAPTTRTVGRTKMPWQRLVRCSLIPPWQARV